jgi:hypothetical protein
MPKRSSKKPPKDEVQIAYSALEHVIRQTESPPKKNQAAVELGRLGGLKGGHARAKALSKKRRTEIARQAATKRWKGQK